MKKFKILLCTLCVMVLSVLFSACIFESEPIDGEELVFAARDKYESYDSAKVLITNEDTDEVEQTFVFKYDEKDSLTYLYEGGYEDENYIQYNNGFECFTEQNGEYTFSQHGDDEFEAYNRDSKHPQASGAYFPFDKGAIEEAVKSEENGETVYTYVYDPNSFDSDAGVSEFSVVYHFDHDGNLLYFEEMSVVEADGEKSDHAYKIEITEINKVDEIENPLKDKAKS